MYLFLQPTRSLIFSRSQAWQHSRIRVLQRQLTQTAFNGTSLSSFSFIFFFSLHRKQLVRSSARATHPAQRSFFNALTKHALSRQPHTFPSSTMSARSSTRTRRATVQPQLVRQVKNLPLSILAKLMPFVWKDSPAAVDEESPKKTKGGKRKTKDHDSKTDDSPAAVDEESLKTATGRKRKNKGDDAKTDNAKDDDGTFNPVSGEESSAEDDDDEPNTSAKPKTTAQKETVASGGKKPKTTTEPKPRKTVVKKNPGAVSKPAARSAPILSDQVSIAADASVAKWRADLDLATSSRIAAAEEARADFYLTMTEVGTRALELIDILALEHAIPLEDQGIIPKGPRPRFQLGEAPEHPPLPAPFKSLWLIGKILRSPVDDSTADASPSTADAASTSTEPIPAGAATTSSTMLLGDPALVEETPGSPTQTHEEEDGQQ
ncbi:hypothetical protein DFH06DRAFT_1376452 [Mycena polygramma]|nr:hypothetical protein DFH06DRAFT_1376452 [Mycena polygramma]